MASYQELYDKVVKELGLLKSDIDGMQQELKNAERDYNEIKAKINELDEKIQTLEKKRDSLVCSKDKMTNIILDILAVIGFSLVFVLNTALSVQLMILLNSLIAMSEFSFVCLSVFLYFGGIGEAAFLNIKILKKLEKVLEQKAYNKIVNSQEYQDILSKIKILEDIKKPLLCEEIRRKYALDVAEEKYNIQKEEISIKEEIMYYIENVLNNSSENVPQTRSSHNRRVRVNKKQET